MPADPQYLLEPAWSANSPPCGDHLTALLLSLPECPAHKFVDQMIHLQSQTLTDVVGRGAQYVNHDRQIVDHKAGVSRLRDLIKYDIRKVSVLPVRRDLRLAAVHVS